MIHLSKVIVEMNFDHEQFDELTDEEKRESIITVLESGAESCRTDIEVKSIQFVK